MDSTAANGVVRTPPIVAVNPIAPLYTISDVCLNWWQVYRPRRFRGEGKDTTHHYEGDEGLLVEIFFPLCE